MRTVIALIVIALLCRACAFPKEVQVRSFTAEVVKIDTTWRWDGDVARIFWKANDITFTEFKKLPITERKGDRKLILLQ